MDGHQHAQSAHADRRWLGAALAVIVVFMAGEVVASVVASSLALLADGGHMLTDAAALGLAIVASRIAQRPPRGAFTYGFARIDALSGQISGITLILLAIWFTVEAARRLAHPSAVQGGIVTIVALIGLAMNLLATSLAARADRASLNVRGVIAHLMTDLWAFTATVIAGMVVLTTGWTRADPIASLVVAAVMVWTGWQLVHAAGRVFLEAAPVGVDPAAVGADLAVIDGVAEIHDLHVWQLGPAQPALSAHVSVLPSHDCHEVAELLRADLFARHGIAHVTLQTDHVDAARHDPDDCAAHGSVHRSG